MTTRLIKLDSFPPGYRVEVDGVHAGDVFKTEHPMYPSTPLWYGYEPGADLPHDPNYTRAESVESLLGELLRGTSHE